MSSPPTRKRRLRTGNARKQRHEMMQTWTGILSCSVPLMAKLALLKRAWRTWNGSSMQLCKSINQQLSLTEQPTQGSDYKASPDKQAEQALSIYPIIDGQKAEKEPTPPRSA